MLGISSIEDAIQPMMPELEENKIEILSVTLKESISKILETYKDGKEIDLATQVEERVLIAFQYWKEEIERVLRPYVVS